MKIKPLCILTLVLVLIISFCCVAESFDNIEVGGVYRIELHADKVLEGIIVEKTDSSIIIESDGSPYAFNAGLIKEIALIVSAKKIQNPDGTTELSYEELRHNSGVSRRLQIKLNNGTIFKGLVTTIDSESVKINVSGSEIPITRDVIQQITTLLPEAVKEDTVQKQKVPEYMKGPFDSVFVVNPGTDENGNKLEPLLIIGKIQQDDNTGIVVLTPQGAKRKILRERIISIQQHTEDPAEKKIKAYAKSLFCPQNMILVDLPPGKNDRPFFKVCVDKYEYPNLKGATPKSNVSFELAQQLCRQEGKRVCSVEEWQWSCSGLEGFTYPYGYRLETEYCNRDGSTNIEPSGNRNKCVGKFGVYDMTGNIFEWVNDEEGNPMLMGGPYSKCQTVSPGLKGEAKPQIGFRCCKGN